MNDWEQIAGPFHHPADTHLHNRSVYLFGGNLIRNRRTGRFAMEMMGGSIRSVPQDWAREIANSHEA